jgi:hypothetical protein
VISYVVESRRDISLRQYAFERAASVPDSTSTIFGYRDTSDEMEIIGSRRILNRPTRGFRIF